MNEMKLKELCAVTDCELCIILGSVQCWAKKTKTNGIDKTFVPRHWFDYKIVDIQIYIDCWDEYYLDIFLETP